MQRALVPILTFVAGLTVGVAATVSAGPAGAAPRPEEPLVTGIGGVFFKAEDPAALRAWYREHLGIDAGAEGAHFVWNRADRPGRTGRTVWSIFPADTDYFGSPDQRLMINYLVDDLDRVLARLAEGGVHPVKPMEEYPFGRFGWVEDGAGNRVELWEPGEPDIEP